MDSRGSRRRLKYTELFWRPITAITLGYGTKTTIEPKWYPMLPTPPHPEYAPSNYPRRTHVAVVSSDTVRANQIATTYGKDQSATIVVESFRSFTNLWNGSKRVSGMSRSL